MRNAKHCVFWPLIRENHNIFRYQQVRIRFNLLVRVSDSPDRNVSFLTAPNTATAQSAAEAAQSVASTAKTTAESAQSSASAAQTAVNTLTTNVGATDTDFVGIYNTAKGVSA